MWLIAAAGGASTWGRLTPSCRCVCARGNQPQQAALPLCACANGGVRDGHGEGRERREGGVRMGGDEGKGREIGKGPRVGG